MKKIIAIGGGDIEKQTTKEIDEYIIKSANKEMPKVLLIPIASNDSAHYIETFINYYSSLNAQVEVLRLSVETNDNLIRSKIFTSNIIYLGGGNTSKMLRVFKRCKVNEYLKQAYERGIIITGISAGAVGLFSMCYSDANRSTNPLNPLSIIKGMGIANYFICPHYNMEERKSFDEVSKTVDINSIAIEDNVAVVLEDENIFTVKSNKDNKAYLFKDNNKIEL